jgi:hypothetical protein
MANTRARSLCPLTEMLETTILFVDESYLCKKCARKADRAYFKNSMEEIHKQKTKVSPRVCVCVFTCVCVCVCQ